MRAMNANEIAKWKSHVPRWSARRPPSVRPSARKPWPSAQPTGDQGPHHGLTTASRHASRTKPVTLMTKRRASTQAKCGVGSIRAGRTTKRR